MVSTPHAGWRRVPLWDTDPAPATTLSPSTAFTLADGSVDRVVTAAGSPAGVALGTASGGLTLLDPASLAPVRAGIAHAGGVVAVVAVQVRGAGDQGRGAFNFFFFASPVPGRSNENQAHFFSSLNLPFAHHRTSPP